MFFYKFQNKTSNKARIQDILVVFGIFFLLSVLIIGLFPRIEPDDQNTPGLYLYLIMTFPAILAVYFIIVSFRRKFSQDVFEFNTSIKTKMAMAFLFVAIFPSLPTILVSNSIVNQTIKSIISDKTYNALESALKLAKDEIIGISKNTNEELNWLKYSLNNNFLSVSSKRGREIYTELSRKRGYIFKSYKIVSLSDRGNILNDLSGDSGKTKFSTGVKSYLNLVNLSSNEIFISRLTISGASLIIGVYTRNNYLMVLYRIIPQTMTEKIGAFSDALKNYEKNRFLKPYFQSFVGIFLFILTLIIVFIAIVLSLFLSKSITKPVLTLTDAAKSVANGNFSVKLEREASDELSLLFQSFNSMVRQLDYSRIINYNMQKLKAWREVSKKLIHEIKNPLTPIQLSAERISKRFSEKHPDIDNIVMMGTKVIVDEVNALQHILTEFTNFARLPEIKPEMNNILKIIGDSVNVFEIYENIKIIFDDKKDVPDLKIDRVLMRQALTNLIKNAIEAVKDKKSGIISIDTEIKSEKFNRWLIIKIEDNGVGISREDIEKLFEPTFTRKQDGTGLGLAIVEKIILEHKGSIYCKSEKGEGTTFFIELPMLD